MMKKTLIVMDRENVKNALELLEVAKLIYQSQSYETYALGDFDSMRVAEGKFNYAIECPEIIIHNPDLRGMVDYLDNLNFIYGFDCILLPATAMGRMLAPRLAMRLHVGLVADVTDIDRTGYEVLLVRPAFSGKIMACISTLESKPLMMTVRQNVFSYTATHSIDTKQINFEYTGVPDQAIKCINKKTKAITSDIRDSRVLVSGGGGMKQAFTKLEELAKALNGQVSASRSIVDSGIAPRSQQVGQSGKTVSPELYIAIGIYGALQHIEGLKNVNYVISVNINKDAPICSLSDIVVEGDGVEFIEKLLKRITE